MIENGCYVSGTWGQYAAGRMISLAESFGWQNEHSVNEDNQNDFDLELLIDLADEAELWLNNHIAPAGTSFGWNDGEFFLWSNSDWESLD